jgi:hypothetical protein
VAIKVCFSFNFVVVFDLQIFPVPPSKAKFNRRCPHEKEKRGNLELVFFSLLQCALPIDAPNHPALLGDALGRGKKIRVIKFGNFRRSKIVPHHLIAQGASLRQYTDNKNNSKQE